MAIRYVAQTLVCEKLIHLPSFLLGGIREREIPDPIPNSEVKPLIADGTTHKSVGE